MKNTEELLPIAQHAAIEAGTAIMNIYKEDFDVEFKVDESPLTIADKEANQVIMSYLLPIGIPVISEENREIPYAERKEWETFWIVDPLDGTKEFIKKNGEFTVNIALIHQGIPVLGVIYVPANKELFFGNESGAFKQINIEHKTDLIHSEKIKLSPKPATEKVKVVASRSHLSAETEEFIQKIKNTVGVESIETVSSGSSLKICMIADGSADVYPRYAPTMEWDVAAGHAICRAAGVKILQAGSESELEYNKENLLNPWFVVGDRFGS
ncbi:MAG: 3'(2'),5'-bisphosphate nucleotidase CysQ [Flavobacteriaceae bacterium]|nr:3'(2'),5'-bisphosphate nucleotidase CysQ [Flavobacteriaceae bacterium]